MFNFMERLGLASLMTIFIAGVIITLAMVAGSINLELAQRGVLQHLYVQEILQFYNAAADGQILQLTHWLASYGVDRDAAFITARLSFWLGSVSVALSIVFLMLTLWDRSYLLTRVLTSLVLVASVTATALMITDASYGGWNILVYIVATAVMILGLLYIARSDEQDEPLPTPA